MAGGLGNFLINELLDHAFGKATFTGAATLYLGLSTADPLATAAGIAEPNTGDYARKSITNNKTNWKNAALNVLANDVAQSFVKATAAWAGPLTHWFLCSEASGAVTELYAFGPLDDPHTIDNGDTATVPQANLSFGIDIAP